MDPEKIREDFPIFQEMENLVYLDNAATSQKPMQVIKAIENFYREKNSNIGRGLYDLAGEATEIFEESRREVAEFIGAKQDEIVFVRNTTEGENLLAHSLEFKGDIVISKMAHHSEQLPWRRKAEKEDKEISFMKTEEGKISIESAREKIDQETGLVAISHVSNVFGVENPVKKIAEIAHENNALIVVDAAQSAPHMPLDVKSLGVDFLCFSGHKMLGPTGAGVLYGRKELLEDMKPYQVGGGMINSVKVDEVEYSRPPKRFEAGTPDVAGAIGLKTAIEYLDSIGMNQIHEHTEELSGRLWDVIDEEDGFRNISPREGNLVSFRCEYAHPHDVAEVLNQSGVAVRAGHHCAQPQMAEIDVNGTVRASTYIYNTREDVKRFREGLEEVRDVFK